MNLETKITIYKFTPQVFTLTRTLRHLRGGRKGGLDFRPKKVHLPGLYLIEYLYFAQIQLTLKTVILQRQKQRVWLCKTTHFRCCSSSISWIPM